MIDTRIQTNINWENTRRKPERHVSSHKRPVIVPYESSRPSAHPAPHCCLHHRWHCPKSLPFHQDVREQTPAQMTPAVLGVRALSPSPRFEDWLLARSISRVKSHLWQESNNVKHPTAVVKPRGEIYMTWSPNSPLLPESFQVRAVFDNIWPCLTFGQIWACSTWLRDQSFQSYFQAELCLKSQIFHRGIWRQGNHATTATEQRDGEGDGHGGPAHGGTGDCHSQTIYRFRSKYV